MAESTPQPIETYTRPARVLHWTVVALLAVQVPVGVYMSYRGNALNLWDALTGALYNGHKLLGVTILALVLVRLAYRVLHGVPADEPTLERWHRVASHLNHWGLYALLVATPIAGYLGVAYFPALDIFGLFKLPAVVAPDKAAAEQAFVVHGVLALLLVLLIAIHVAAALYHHFVRNDSVLARMIPRLGRSAPRAAASRAPAGRIQK